MTAPTAPATCPRCSRPLVRSWDEVFCLTHGTIEPAPNWDALRDDPLERECHLCPAVMRTAGSLAVHLRSHEGMKLRPPGLCPCCGRTAGIDLCKGDANHWCYRCSHGRHIDGCTRIPRTAEAARQRKMPWPVSAATGDGGETGGDA